MKSTGWKTGVDALALTSLLYQACYATEINTIATLMPEPGTNYCWNQQGINAAREAGKKEGVNVLVSDNLGYGDVFPTLRDLADDGAQLFIAHASGNNQAAPEIGAQAGIPVAITGSPSSFR